MASKNMATILQRNTPKIIVLLFRALLEWVLIILLLCNSVFYFFITKFCTCFGLKTPCIWCSRVDHWLSHGGAKGANFYEELICDSHANEISNLCFCSIHQKLHEAHSMCEICLPSHQKCHGKSAEVIEEKDENDEKMTKCSCCGKGLRSKTTNDYDFSSNPSRIMMEVKQKGSTEIEEMVDDKDFAASDEINCEHTRSSGIKASRSEELDHDPGDAAQTMEELRFTLEVEREARSSLYTELEVDRNAYVVATNQTMAMITRVQEEKAKMQMEALQYHRMMEEQAEYHQQELQLLNELVMKREKEKEEIEKELEMYRERVLEYEEKEKSIAPCGGFAIDSDSDVLSIDLNPEESRDKDVSLIECAKQWGDLEDSLMELEQERLSILQKLNDLEEKIHTNSYEQEKPIYHLHENPIIIQSEDDQFKANTKLCSSEVNLMIPTDLTCKTQPMTMASAAQRLLGLVGSADVETKGLMMSKEVEWDKKIAIEKEMDHVYGRLQALEADKELLRHCIGSLKKGDKGIVLLQEILCHLHELRAAKICL